MKKVVLMFISLTALSMSGCASVSEAYQPDTNFLRDKTAGSLGYAPSQIKISGIRSSDGETYYVANTPKGTYGCTTKSGAWQAMTSASAFGAAGSLTDIKCQKQ